MPAAENNAVSQVTLYFVMNGGCSVTMIAVNDLVLRYMLVELPEP